MNNGNDRVTSSDEFNEALAELVHEAVLSGIDVEGGWDLSKSDYPEFTVEIYRLDNG
jgi:hypothetical protein